MTMKFLLINGPKKVGKSTLADGIDEVIRPCVKDFTNIDAVTVRSFATEVKRGTMRELEQTNAIARKLIDTVGIDYLISTIDKDAPNLYETGKSFREFCIEYAERVKKHNPCHFVQCLLSEIDEYATRDRDALVVIDDVRFQIELDAVVRLYSCDNVSLVRLKPDGYEIKAEETEFEKWGDTGGYVHFSGRTVDVTSLVGAGRFRVNNKTQVRDMVLQEAVYPLIGFANYKENVKTQEENNPPIDWNKPVQTRDGRTVEILTTGGRKPGRPIVGYVADNTYLSSWAADGKHEAANGIHDLVNAPEERELWINVYPNKDKTSSHPSKESADRYSGSKRIACVHVKYKVGEGLE